MMCLEPMLNFWKIPLSFHISTSYILVLVGEDGWGVIIWYERGFGECTFNAMRHRLARHMYVH